jgi:paraquat-inducible protein A
VIHWIAKVKKGMHLQRMFYTLIKISRMQSQADKRSTAVIILIISGVFFVLGLMFPILQTGYGIGPITIRQEKIYLASSFNYFFDQGEIFIGFILLFFTLIFPILKYIFLFYVLSGRTVPKQGSIAIALEIINKWSMLDVFVVAVLILNMKFSSEIIISRLESGTTLFAVSVVFMMVASFLTRRMETTKTSLP